MNNKKIFVISFALFLIISIALALNDANTAVYVPEETVVEDTRDGIQKLSDNFAASYRAL